MPMFFFDLHDPTGLKDVEGREFPGIPEATAYAYLEAREMIRASVDEGGPIDLHHRIEIRDSEGQVLANIRFDDAVQIMRNGVTI